MNLNQAIYNPKLIFSDTNSLIKCFVSFWKSWCTTEEKSFIYN